MAQLEHITPEQIEQYGVVAAPDRLTGKARDNKMIFDRLVRELVALVVNDIIDKTNELLTAEDVREENERNRVAAENLRVQAEKLRVQAEQARVTAENERVQAEANRVAAELLRVKAEQLRASAEQARVQAEQGRVTAEQAREQAEKDREDTTNGIVAQATDQAKTAESWAIGGTGTRLGEDTNNAKYWAGQAENAAGGSYADKQLSNLDTPQLALANLGAGVRPRLGINMDFTVNQRGQQSYTTGGHTLDGWKATFVSLTSGSVNFNDPGITMTAAGNSDGYLDIAQYFKGNLLGKTMTFSVLYDDGTFLTITGAVPSQVPSKDTTIASKQNDKTGIWIRINKSGLVFTQIRAKPGNTISPVSAKPEEGEGQTLAYEDSDGVWHRLPQPEDGDYGMQLEKCREYFRRFNAEFSFLGTGYAISESTAIVFIPLTRPMRLAAPTATLKGTVYLWENGNTAGSSFPSIELVSGSASIGNENTLAQVQFKTSGLTPGLPVAAQIRDTSSYFDIDANL